MDMPKVAKCDVTDCAYNRKRACHALAITVGDEAHPKCDTYCQSMTKGGDPSAVGMVGACKVMACRFNNSLECTAKSIEVGYSGEEVDCLTFEEK